MADCTSLPAGALRRPGRNRGRQPSTVLFETGSDAIMAAWPWANSVHGDPNSKGGLIAGAHSILLFYFCMKDSPVFRSQPCSPSKHLGPLSKLLGSPSNHLGSPSSHAASFLHLAASPGLLQIHLEPPAVVHGRGRVAEWARGPGRVVEWAHGQGHPGKPAPGVRSLACPAAVVPRGLGCREAAEGAHGPGCPRPAVGTSAPTTTGTTTTSTPPTTSMARTPMSLTNRAHGRGCPRPVVGTSAPTTTGTTTTSTPPTTSTARTPMSLTNPSTP